MSPAGLAGTQPTPPGPHPPCRRPTGSPSSNRSHPKPMPRTYADLLKEARATIKEVTPAQVGALQPGGAAIVDVREASEWEQGHLPDADPHQQELRRAADRERRPGSGHAGHPLLRGRRPVPLRGPVARAARLHERRLDVGRLPGLEVAGPAVGGAGRPQQRPEAALQPPPADPRGRREGPAAAARVEGAAHRRRRSRVPGGALPRGRRRRHDRHRRLRRRRPLEPPAPDPAHERPGRRAQGRVGPEDARGPQSRT